MSRRSSRASAAADKGAAHVTRGVKSESSKASALDPDSTCDDEDVRQRRGGNGGVLSLEAQLRKAHKAKMLTRPFYSSEEDDGNLTTSPLTADATSTGAYRTAQRRSHTQSACLTHRIFHRPPPAIKQWPISLALARGPPATMPTKTGGWQYVSAEGVPVPVPAADVEMRVKQEEPSMKTDEAAATATKSQVPLAYARPFDVQRPPEPASSVPSSVGGGAAAAAQPDRYWVYTSPAVKRIGKDPGYSVTDHTWYCDGPVIRASPSLTPSELSALVPVSPGDACRSNGLTFIRQMRVKVKNETRAELARVMKTVTGEIDRKVLKMCDYGHVSKCRVYKTDDYNYTLITTEPVLSGEPLCAWMGTLRERNTFAQRVGFETSLTHIWAYEIGAVDLPPGYTGPDLVIDASEYGNESHFFRDPKWSHQQADANVTCRLVWNQKTGLPYLVFVALCDIAPHAELFIDWGDKCWKIVWKTQLTALATNSHLAHAYLKSLQNICRTADINVLPQLARSKFAARPTPEDEAKADQQRFLDEELSPFRTTSATTLEKRAPRGANKRKHPHAKKGGGNDTTTTTITTTITTTATAVTDALVTKTKEWPPAADIISDMTPADPATPSPPPSHIESQPLLPVTATSSDLLLLTSATPSSASASSSSPTPLGEMPPLDNGSAASTTPSPPPESELHTPMQDTRTSPTPHTHTTSPKRRTRPHSALHIQTDLASLSASPSGDSSGRSSPVSSVPSSPYTPSFNTHKAFVATASHTMLTVFASALLRENLRELERIRRRLMRHRLNRFRRGRSRRKPLLQGAMHVHGQHTFELLQDSQVAFFKSRTRLGREAKVAVSDETKTYVAEAFKLLRPIDLPLSRDAKLIRDGTVPKASVYEVVGLKHPARFFTRPDQTPYALVATERYAKEEPIGVYIGVFRDFHQFHKASDADAMAQVYAYDCHAQQIPGPPNPFLSAEEKRLPLHEQLSYRGGDLIVESLYYGNEIRFMNDCYGRSGTDGTVNAYATIAWDQERGWPCILIRAQTTITKGDEIVCDYGDNFWNKVARSLMMDHAAYGDEVRAMIDDTERWLTLHGLALPTRPTERENLPTLFTADIRAEGVVYPRHFLKPFDADSDPAPTEEQAEEAIRQGKKKVEQLRAEVCAREAAEAAAAAAAAAAKEAEMAAEAKLAADDDSHHPDSVIDYGSTDDDLLSNDARLHVTASTRASVNSPRATRGRGGAKKRRTSVTSPPTVSDASPPARTSGARSHKRIKHVAEPVVSDSNVSLRARIVGEDVVRLTPAESQALAASLAASASATATSTAPSASVAPDPALPASVGAYGLKTSALAVHFDFSAADALAATAAHDTRHAALGTRRATHATTIAETHACAAKETSGDSKLETDPAAPG